MGPSGQITKLTTISNALKMLVVTVPKEDKGHLGELMQVDTTIKGLAKSLRKEKQHAADEETRPF